MIGRDDSRPILQRLTAAAGLMLVAAIVLAGCQATPTTDTATKQGGAIAKVEGAVTQAMTETKAAMTQAVTETKPVTEATHAMTATQGMTDTAGVPADGETVMLHKDPKLGEILVDGKGMTLYVFDKDMTDKSNCTGECLVKWPHLEATDAATLKAGAGITGKLATIKRDDGKLQVTVNGMPLYYYYQDKEAGDTTGQAVGDVWWVVGADGNKITAK